MKPIWIILLSCVVTCLVVFSALAVFGDKLLPQPTAAPVTEAEEPAEDTAGETPDTPAGYANVLDYGADATGSTDSTEAIQAAVNENRLVYFPAGTYRFERLRVTASVTLQGAGDNATILKTSNLTDNVITLTADGWHVRDMKFDATANRTGGAYLFSTANYASVENVAFTRQYIGIDLDGSWSVNLTNLSAFDGTPHEAAPGGASSRLGNNAYTGPVNIRGLTAKPSSATLQPTSGIHLGYVDVVSISDALIIWHRKDVVVAPKTRQFAALVEITNSCFDTALHGVSIEPTGGGRVLRCGVSNTWFGAHSADALTVDGADGTVTGLQFSNCMFLANAGNGVAVRGQGVDGLYFSNCFSGGNQGCGLTAADGAQEIVWDGGVLGACHELAGNVQYGYSVAEGCGVTLDGTDLEGNNLGQGQGPAVQKNMASASQPAA